MSVALDLDSLLAPSPVPARRPRLRVVPAEPETFAPVQPAPARPGPVRLAPVSVLHAPATSTEPLRLTRRGVAVLAVLTAALGMALVWVAATSAHASAQSSGRQASVATGPAVVTVHPGDTLWALASRVAPGRDPRAEVAELQRLNHLASPSLQPGQTLRVR